MKDPVLVRLATAAVLHCFRRDLEHFEKSLATFAIPDKAPAR